jgi:hypothetical protein
MDRDPLLTLLGLLAVTIFASGALVLLLRVGRSPVRADEIAKGYPPERFPRRDLIALPPLAALAASQARLLAVHAQLPARGEAAVWLRAYLVELRAIMDTAYRVAGIGALYADLALLERVAAEVSETERVVAREAMQHLLRADDDFDPVSLDGRLAVLRRFAQQLAG